jgi:hypothetical protein
MAYDDSRLGDYIDVAARIAEFRSKHPDGSLQPAREDRPFEVVEIAGQTFVAVVAAAYRTPDDPRPGIGMAYEQFPGRTPYTRGSELQNAETSAWGRAIVAALAADTKKGIASAEEIRNRQAERDQPFSQPYGGRPPRVDEPKVTEAQHRRMHALWRDLGFAGEANRGVRLDVTGKLVGRQLDSSAELTEREADLVIEALVARKAKQDTESATPVPA